MRHRRKQEYYERNGIRIKTATASTPIMDKDILNRITYFIEDMCKHKDLHFKYYILWRLSLGLGFRISDTLKLTVEDVTKCNNDIIEKKTGKERMVILNDKLQAIVDWYIKEYNLNPDDMLIFSNSSKGSKKKAIDRSQAYRKLKELVNRVDETIRFSNHTLRKSWAYALYIANDKNIAVVQKALNHSSSLTTADYIGLSQQELKKILVKFDPLE